MIESLNELKVDYLSILKTQSVTGKTEAMMAEIDRQLKKIPNISMEKDTYGNLYVTKGKKGESYPAFVCHTDTVHKPPDEDKKIKICKTTSGNLFAYAEDDHEWEAIGIGGDDKVGIILCIDLLNRLTRVKCVFFLDEESGCKGSAAGNLEFFDDCRYAIQIDRKGNEDIITTGSGTRLCSNDFENHLDEIGKKYGYKHTTGFNTDVVKLKDRGLGISAVNLSCGYYNPHHKDEYININDMLWCLGFCIAISKIKTVYPHKIEKKVYEKPTYSGYSGYNSPFSGNRDYTRKSNQLTIRNCRECSYKLDENESVMCRQCVHRHADTLVLVIDKDTGQKFLTSGAYPMLPPEFDTQLPSDKCLVCMTPISVFLEKERGYCEQCIHCGDCGLDLVFPEEIILAKHHKCPQNLKEALKDERFCGSCDSILFDDLSILEKECRECKEKVLL